MKNPKYKFIQRTNKGSGVTFYNDNFDILVDNVYKWRRDNNQLGHKEDYNTVYNSVRSQNINHPRITVTQSNAPMRHSKNFAQVMNGAKAIVSLVSGDVVSQSEYNRRSKICADCPLKSKVSNCFGCGAGTTIARRFRELSRVGGKTYLEYKTPLGPVNYLYCGICDCSLGLMVMSKMSRFRETKEENLKRPTHCWVRKDSPNYIEDGI